MRIVATITLVGCLLLTHLSAADMRDAWEAYQRRDFAAAARELGPLAEAGDRDAQFMLAGLLAAGRGVDPDPVEAHKWFSLAAEQDHPGAAKGRDVTAREMTTAELEESNRRRSAWRQRREGGAAPAAKKKGGFLSGLVGAARGLTGALAPKSRSPRRTTTAIGIRGLGASDLRTARPDPAELAKLERGRVSPSEAAAFARTAGLEARPVPYLESAAPGAEPDPDAFDDGGG